MKPPVFQFTVILADDEISILEGLNSAISWAELGISIVAQATNGPDALGAILEHDPDFAVIDIRMPGLNGLEVIQRAKNSGVKTNFIILSGYNDFSYAKDAIRYGAKAYLLKPVNSQELYDELYRLCLEQSKLNPGSTSRLYQEKLNHNFLSNLIDSKILEPGMVRQILNRTEIALSDSTCYTCVLLYEPADDTGTPADLPAKEIIACLNEQFRSEKYVFWKYNETQIIGIFNSSSVVPFQRAVQCLDALRDRQLPLPVIGLGDTVSGLLECAYSYSRALTAVTYQLYDSSSQIFTYEVICVTPPTVRLSDIDYMPLVQSIVRKDLTGIRTYCSEFIDKLLYVPMPPPNYVFSLCYALFHLIEEEFSNFSHQEITAIATAQDLYRFKRLAQIREWMGSSFCQLAEFIDAVYGYATPKYAAAQKNLPETDDPVIKTAKEFIHRNITNHLKIEDIARHVHLSPSYFAIYFKSKTNMNLRDFLLAEKMEYARRILMNPATAVTNVAYDLGYGDYRSFSRAFKNVHGITPSDFQAKYRYEESPLRQGLGEK